MQIYMTNLELINKIINDDNFKSSNKSILLKCLSDTNIALETRFKLLKILNSKTRPCPDDDYWPIGIA